MASQGADRVNGELEVGFDRVFERRWHVVELIGRGFMVLFVVAGVLGFLGQGPFSHATARDPTHNFAVDYEPVSRFGTATQVTFHIRAADPGTQTIHLNTSFGEPLGLQSVLPQPVRQTAEDGGFSITVATPAEGDDILVRLSVKPSAIGRIHLSATTDARTISWTQLVLP